ncbi:MAG: hypothetical protein HN686_01500 [Bacteroidetes bacterium]|nr:hypothetical protein [Bacteroidota bacterium]
MPKWTTLICVIVLLFGCQKTTLPDTFQVTATVGFDNAELSWTSFSSNGEEWLFKIFLNDSLIHEDINIKKYDIQGLEEMTFYACRVLLTSGSYRDSLSETFTFTTQENLPPEPGEITVVGIGSNSISISWSPSFDPEGFTVWYDVFLGDSLVCEDLRKRHFTFNNLDPNKTYQLSVLTRDRQGKESMVTENCISLKSGAFLGLLSDYFDGRPREYGIYEPSDKWEGKRPVVIYLHGHGHYIWPFMMERYFPQKAEKEGFIFLMPQAFEAEQGQPAWQPEYYSNWNDFAFIDELIEKMINENDADRERIYLSGFSNGGFMTYLTAKKLEHKLAAIAPMGGLISTYEFPKYSLRERMPLCHIHGSADDVVELYGNDTHVSFDLVLEQFLGFNQLMQEPIVYDLPDKNRNDNSTITRYDYQNSNEETWVRFYLVNNGKHSYPGIQNWSNMDAHAADLIWEFCNNFKLSDK